VLAALADLAAADAVARYPADGAPALRAALARQDGVRPEQLIVANGAVEVLWFISLAYLETGDRVLVVGPTFGEYARAARVAGAEVVEWRGEAADGFVPDVDAIQAAINRHRPRLAFLCNPNNPTGTCLDQARIAALLDAVGDALLVVDVAYASFAAVAPDLRDLLADERLVLLHSLTKTYALAGLRLGYAVASAEVIGALDQVRPPWTVNAAAIACGLAALADPDHAERARVEVAGARSCLVQALAECGLYVYPPTANFVLVEVGNGRQFRSRLLERGVCVRDCASFGLPTCIRIGVPARAHVSRVVDAVRGVLADGSRTGL
jgi:histidinol-phosphate aminotransferase